MKIAQILISGVWGEVSPAALERGIGGREGALIYLSREWAKMGHEVTNFVDVEQGQRFKEEYHLSDVHFEDGSFYHAPGFHEYVPLNMARPMLANFPWDVAIAWECPSAFEDHRILQNTRLRICEMQVCHFGFNEQEGAENFCDYVAALSKWHKNFLINSGLEMSDDEVVVFPNGVDMSRYQKRTPGRKFTDNPKVVYSSSPDRGLWQLLQVWPLLLKDFPNAELFVAYGLQNWLDFNRWSHGRPGEMAVEIERLMKQKGITDLGKIGQDKLAELQLEADVWLYPLDAINPTESGCITAVENAAAGNPIITTDCDCMASEFGRIGRVVDLPFDPKKFYEAVKDVLTDEEYYSELQKKGWKFAEGRDWSKIAAEWVNLFHKTLEPKSEPISREQAIEELLELRKPLESSIL